MKRLLTALILLAVAAPLVGCVVETPRSSWCYYHPYRCR